jgi:serine/threonine-protein kinase HipA
MTDAYRTAYVYVRNTFTGELCETDEGYSFAYDKDYLALPDASAVSLTLPLQTEAYTSNTIFPFFDGLIPEGWLLDVVSRNWKIDRNDRFGLLLVACRDSVGNVSIWDVRV